MEEQKRKTARTWATDQLLSKTQTPIYVVKWYELVATNTTEVEVGAQGRTFSREIANGDLEEEHRRGALEEIIEGLAREIDTLRDPPAGS
jgi:hypothetical protein